MNKLGTWLFGRFQSVNSSCAPPAPQMPHHLTAYHSLFYCLVCCDLLRVMLWLTLVHMCDLLYSMSMHVVTCTAAMWNMWLYIGLHDVIIWCDHHCIPAHAHHSIYAIETHDVIMCLKYQRLWHGLHYEKSAYVTMHIFCYFILHLWSHNLMYDASWYMIALWYK